MEREITLFAMMQRGFDTLRALVSEFPSAIGAVVSARDSHVTNDFFDDIAALCGDHHIPFRERTHHFQTTTKYAIAISWRWLIDPRPAQLMVLHDSLLPRYRGFGPLVSALINGDRELGVTAVWASDRYDAGDIIEQASSAISYPIRIQQAIGLTSGLYQRVAVNVVRCLLEGRSLPRIAQDETQATYSLWRDDQDYQIDWMRPADEIRRFIDAVGAPYLGAATRLKHVRARILEADVADDARIENRTPGKVFAFEGGKPIVVCGTGMLKVIDLVDDESRVSLLPLSSLRIRFT
jgi:methionyl-tRNA formyltransferase